MRLLFICAICCFPLPAYAETSDDADAIMKVLSTVMPKAEAMVVEGRYAESHDMILKAFPEKLRTPQQSLMLANVFYKQNPELSYALHKQAAAALPKDAAAQFEWAMEQHRAKEYAAAGETYAKVIKLGQTTAGIYGLWAECLIRTGKIKEAAETWKLSEQATGSLEDLETWVCEVNSHLFPDCERAKLLPKASQGDIAAARDLIALDTDFRRDWWNGGPHLGYLKHDLALLRMAKFADEPRLKQILCLGDCALADDAAKPGVLRKAGLLLDAKRTLPEDGIVLSALLNQAFSCNAISKEDAKAKWSQAIWEKAKATKDAETFNVAANLNLGSDKMLAINRAGWQATSDERFGASLLAGLSASKTFSLDDPEVKQIVEKLPEHWAVARIVLGAAARQHLPLRPKLVQAIKAEYTHFSINGGLSIRPGAAALRRYFVALSKDFESGKK